MKKNNKSHKSGKTRNALTALMSAAMALPIVALPLPGFAQALSEEWVPPILPIGASMGVRTLYYREAHGRMKVNEPVVWLKSPVGENWEVSASATLDLVSGASPIIVSNQTGKPTQILTGASITDRRKAVDGAVKRRFGDLSLSVSRTVSNEKDYDSHATGANLTYDFNERNTTLAIGYGASNDRVMSVTNADLHERRDTREYLLGVTQLLDRHSLVQSNLTLTQARGYLSDPYKLTVSVFGDPRQFVLARDSRPAARDQWAWLTRYKRNLATQNAVVSAEYRLYRDDWGIRSHTVAAQWLQSLNDRWKVELRLRYYSQSAADFYRAEIRERPAPNPTSSDQRLAGFGALEPGIKVIYQLRQGTALDLGVSVYRQQGSWKLGGQGSSSFEPLQAVLVNAGIVHRF
jgi:Protein of unknown function (DUF3570)